MQNKLYQEYSLDNGIRLIFRKNLSSVGHIGFLVNAGTRDENKDELGLAHFIEHTLFKGTERRKAYQIINRLEDVGGELDAYTTKEDTFISATFLKNYFDRAIELISDIAFNSTFPEKELEKEKEVVIDEINSYKDNPSELIFDEFENMVFSNHPLGHDILGTKASVKKLSSKKIKTFIKNNYGTNEIIITVVGSMEFKTVKNKFIKYFKEIPANIVNNNRNENVIFKKQEIIKSKDTFQSHCLLGGVAYKTAHKNRLDLILLNNLIGGPGMNSLLNMSLREKHGLVYNVESSYSHFNDTGYWSIYLGTDKHNLNKAIDLAEKILKQKRDKLISTSKLNKTKKQILGQIAIGAENYSDYVFSMAKSKLIYGKISTFAEIEKAINEITPSSLLETANEIYTPENTSVLIYK